MTIFQKMLFVPILSLLMYACFITYSYFEHQQSSANIQELREAYVPAIEYVNDNVYLFRKLQEAFKDAVVAQESRWITDTLEIQGQINSNLLKLKSYPHIIDKQIVNTATRDFNQYYKSANALAATLLSSNGQWAAEESLLHDVSSNQSAVTTHFESMKIHVQSRFQYTLNETQSLQRQLLFWGGLISVSSMILLLLVTLAVSYSTKRNLLEIIQRTKALAQGSTDFSQRIERTNRDELGILVHWFNKLTNKLEEDYLKLKAISITDKLTQLNNRNRTDQFLPLALQDAKNEGESVVIVIVDIDHFKQVNDTFGHLAGDKVLKHFATTLKQTATASDYISRWGGEEFLLIWQHTDLISAGKKANAIREAIAELSIPEVGSITASFGVAIATDNDTQQSIISRADANLYHAKELGRNRVVIDKELNLF